MKQTQSMDMFVKICLIGIILVNLGFVLCKTKDYYELLGISRDASKSEIRKAFKKIALEKHPDRNQDDPNAHETFTKINKAYETLKDDELRKKYDTYGEEGLKDDHFSNQYQSWNFYNEQFGIYDEDPEIITLSYSDFEQSVSGTEDIWFINFYSPHCSHCHTLAPTWREVARELTGVIRIGAVNCQDDWSLCNMQGIRSYPSLRLYPTGEYFYGGHDKEEMMKYILSRVETHVVRLDMDYVVNELQKSELPIVISFCGTIKDDCPSERTILKLSVMLDNLVGVATVNCEEEEEVCNHFGKTENIVFYPVGEAKKDSGTIISSMDATEIMEEVLKLLAQPISVDAEVFESIKKNVSYENSSPWVFIFLSGNDEHNVEMMKLTALIPEMNIGSIDCQQSKELCTQFFISKYPSVILYKWLGYEHHHGRYNAHDMALFARESAVSNVVTLAPKDFPHVTEDTQENWYIDFFTPWCPPCLKLLPEWRKAGKQIGGQIAHFGTVDCTIHQQLCKQYNVNSYPTTVFYNKSEPHTMTGYHSVEQIISFAEDVLKPPVVKLTPETFESLVNKKAIGETWLVDFYAPWCGPCMELAPTYRKLAKKLEGEAKLGEVDCQKYPHFCQLQNVNSYPTVRLYPHDSKGTSRYVRHQGWRDLDSLYTWVFQHFPSSVEHLDHYGFVDGVLNSEDAYLVDFFAPWCGHCHVFAPSYEKLAQRLEGKVKCAKIDCDAYPNLCRQAGIRQYPTVKIYVGAFSEEMSQNIQGRAMNTLDIDQLETSALYLRKEHLEEKQRFQQQNIVHDEF